MTQTDKPDWSPVERDMRLHIVQNAATYLDGQIGLATAADQRASTLAGVFAAAGTALIAAVVAFATTTITGLTHPYLMIMAALVCAFCFLVAGFLCMASALPVDMYLPGTQPEDWYGDVAAARKYDDCLASEAEIVQEKINDNRLIIKRNARLYKFGILLGIGAPVLGLITGFGGWVVSLPILAPCAVPVSVVLLAALVLLLYVFLRRI